MKKVMLYFFVLALTTALFTSCEKDETFAEATEQITAQSEGKIVDTDTGERRHRCGSDAHMEELLKNPDYLKVHEGKFAAIKNVVKSRSCSSPTVLPIAVHYQGVTGANAACLAQLAQSQVAVLNADYQGTNSDISIWNGTASSSFPGISNGESCLGFQIATQNHPPGYGLSNGDLAITINKFTGDSNNDWSGYLNIFVIPNTGYLGYSPYGGAGNGDGVVIDAAAFGAGNGCGSVAPESPYNLGRTLTHEMGHYLFLDHIWGNGCGSDDGVSDTPNSQSDYGGCPSIGESSCNSTDMHMNYMDYTNDECMYMFSAGQATRMESYVTSSLSNVVSKASSVLSSGGNGDDGGGETTPTCSDGVQNGTETGVDCGGSCAPCNEPELCTAPTTSTATQLDATTVQLNWNAVSGANRYRVIYRLSGTSRWTGSNTVATQKNLPNLTPGATYQYRLRTRCSSDNQWTGYSPIKTFTVTEENGGGDDGDCLDLIVQIRLDDYGSETSWDITNEAGEVVVESPTYSDGQAGTIKRTDICLPDGCYTLNMYDDYGDGLCCDYGNGRYWLKNADRSNIFTYNGNFGTFEATDFCIDPARVPQMREQRQDKKLNKPLKTK